MNSDRPTPADYDNHFIRRFAERLEASGLPEELAVIKKGQAFVWAANLAHGGSAVADLRSTRRSLVVHWYFKDCLYFTPVVSDVEAGRLALRLPPNIASGGWAWPRRAGRLVYPGHKQLAAAMFKRLFRKLHIT